MPRLQVLSSFITCRSTTATAAISSQGSNTVINSKAPVQLIRPVSILCPHLALFPISVIFYCSSHVFFLPLARELLVRCICHFIIYQFPVCMVPCSLLVWLWVDSYYHTSARYMCTLYNYIYFLSTYLFLSSSSSLEKQQQQRLHHHRHRRHHHDRVGAQRRGQALRDTTTLTPAIISQQQHSLFFPPSASISSSSLRSSSNNRKRPTTATTTITTRKTGGPGLLGTAFLLFPAAAIGIGVLSGYVSLNPFHSSSPSSSEEKNNSMSSKLIPTDPAKVMVIRDVTPNVVTFSVPFKRFGTIPIGGRGTLGESFF